MCNIEGKKQRERERIYFMIHANGFSLFSHIFYLKGNKDEFVKNYEN